MNTTYLSALFSDLLNMIQSPLFSLGTQPITILWLAKCLLLLLVVLLAAKWSKLILKKRLLVGFVTNEGDREVISSLAAFATATIGIALVLQVVGLKLESLAIIVGGMGVGIGFGLQDLTKNLVSGITLLGERKLRVGDLIEFKGIEGYIEEISIRSTVVRTFHGSELVIPNAELSNSQVENWSYQSRRGRIDIPVLVDHRSDPVLVTEVLLRAAYMEKAVLFDPAPKVVFKGFGEVGLNFELWIWVDPIDRGAAIKSAMNFLIEYYFRQHAIKIAYRQGDSWLPGNDMARDMATVQTARSQSLEATPLYPTPPLREMLLGLRYFKDFDEIELRGLIELGYRKHLGNGEILVNQGKYHQAFCVVLEGSIDAIYENDKISRRLFTFQTGEFFGELPLLLKIPYPTTMRAVGDTTLFLIASEGFHYLLDRYPKLKDDVTEELTKRQENIQLCQATLRTLGLLTDEHVANPVTWLRNRLKKLMGDKSGDKGNVA